MTMNKLISTIALAAALCVSRDAAHAWFKSKTFFGY